MELQWMLKPASSGRTEGTYVRKVDNVEKDESAREEVMAMHLLCM